MINSAGGGETGMGRKIILDVDPGHDDAIAILVAGKSELDVWVLQQLRVTRRYIGQYVMP